MLRSAVIGIDLVLLIARFVTTVKLTPQASESDEQTHTFSAQTIKTYDVHTENGAIEFNGREEAAKPVEIVVERKAWADDHERAKQALAAIEVTIEGQNSSTCKVGWHWKGEKQHDWSGNVDFTIRAPKFADIEATSINGQVTVDDLSGKAKIVTENGRIETKTKGESLDIQTKNGTIEAEFTGQKVQIQAQNGSVTTDLHHCSAIEGTIKTANGPVTVTVGDQTSCELEAKTTHGHIDCNVDLQDMTSESGGLGPMLRRVLHGRKKNKSGMKQTLTGKLGEGGSRLLLSTENGAIQIDD